MKVIIFLVFFIFSWHFLQAENNNHPILPIMTSVDLQDSSKTLAVNHAKQSLQKTDYLIGFIDGFSSPIFSTIYISFGDFGQYPEKIPSATDPFVYRSNFYQQTAHDRKRNFQMSSVAGGIVSLIVMQQIIIHAVD